ncbi:atlastin-2-like [Crassostrea virginica]
MVLLHPDVKDKPVVIVSVAGPFREGHAPLLGFFLKYLATEGSDWLSDDDQIKWYDQKQDPFGIHIWSKPFSRSDKDGQEVAVLLMETRGAFDCKMTADDFAGIFALSSLISSVQIYNIMSQIQEDDLQPLKFLIDFKKTDTEDSDCNQSHLLFLMRNWKCKASYSYGENGGNAYVFDLLHTAEVQHETVKTFRWFFPNIGGCLLPNPGEAIDYQDLRNVHVKEFNAEFIKHMKEFVPSIMAEDKLMSNTIVRRDMKGKDMLEFVLALVSAFENDSTPKSLLEATVDFGRDKAVYDAYEFYAKEMDKFYSDHHGWSRVSEEETTGYHLKMKEEAKRQFDENPRMKIKNTEEKSRHELEEKIEKKFQEVKSQIDENNSFLSALYYAGGGGAGGAALSFFLLLLL